jgi:hypothetical protein
LKIDETTYDKYFGTEKKIFGEKVLVIKTIILFILIYHQKSGIGNFEDPIKLFEFYI